MGVYISEINMPKSEGSKLVLQIFPNGEVYDEHGIRLGITNWAEAVPAVDVRPAVHGNWIKHDDDAIECSVCGLGLESFIAGVFFRFCPFCGAKMDGES